MQPCSREMQAINSLLNPSQIPLQQHHSQIQNPHFEPASHDDFLEQMLSSLPSCSWADPAVKSSPWDPRPDETAPSSNPSDNVGFHATHFSDEPAILASKLRQHQISGGSPSAAPKMMMQHQHQHQIMMMPLSLGTDRPQNDVVDGSSSSSFKSPNSHQGGEGSGQGLYNGFGGGSLHGAGQAPNHPQHFHHPQGGSMQAQNLGGPGGVMNQGQGQGQGQVQGQSQAQASGSTGGAAAQPRQRVRARRGQATDPHSIAERLRRERIAERMKALQELVPNANKTDKASMLDEIIDYVKFLQLQVKVLSMSRLGGAAAVAPLVADISSEGGGDCIQASSNANASSHSNNHTASSNDSLTVTEHQVAKLMEEDMGSAMQYLQGKGLCLMPISLATAISTATCHSRNPIINNSSNSNNNNNNNNPLLQPNADGPSSPSMSVLTVQSATVGNGGPDTSAKDAASVSKP